MIMQKVLVFVLYFKRAKSESSVLCSFVSSLPSVFYDDPKIWQSNSIVKAW